MSTNIKSKKLASKNLHEPKNQSIEGKTNSEKFKETNDEENRLTIEKSKDSKACTELIIKDTASQVKLTDIINNSIKEAVLTIVQKGIGSLATDSQNFHALDPSKKSLTRSSEVNRERETFSSHKNPCSINNDSSQNLYRSNDKEAPNYRQKKIKARKENDKSVRESGPKILRKGKMTDSCKKDNRRMTGNVNIYICSETNDNAKASAIKQDADDECLEESETGPETKKSDSSSSLSTGKLLTILKKKKNQKLNDDSTNLATDSSENQEGYRSVKKIGNFDDKVLCLCDKNLEPGLPDLRSLTSQDVCTCGEDDYLDFPDSEMTRDTDFESSDRYASYEKDYCSTSDDYSRYRTDYRNPKSKEQTKTFDKDYDGCSCCKKKFCRIDESSGSTFVSKDRETLLEKSHDRKNVESPKKYPSIVEEEPNYRPVKNEPEKKSSIVSNRQEINSQEEKSKEIVQVKDEPKKTVEKSVEETNNDSLITPETKEKRSFLQRSFDRMAGIFQIRNGKNTKNKKEIASLEKTKETPSPVNTTDAPKKIGISRGDTLDKEKRSMTRITAAILNRRRLAGANVDRSWTPRRAEIGMEKITDNQRNNRHDEETPRNNFSKKPEPLKKKVPAQVDKRNSPESKDRYNGEKPAATSKPPIRNNDESTIRKKNVTRQKGRPNDRYDKEKSAIDNADFSTKIDSLKSPNEKKDVSNINQQLETKNNLEGTERCKDGEKSANCTDFPTKAETVVSDGWKEDESKNDKGIVKNEIAAKESCSDCDEQGFKSMICMYCDTPQNGCTCHIPIRKCSQCGLSSEICNCKATSPCDCKKRRAGPTKNENGEQTIRVTAWKPRSGIRRYFGRSVNGLNHNRRENCSCCDNSRPYGSEELPYQRRDVFSNVMSELHQKIGSSVSREVCGTAQVCCHCVDDEESVEKIATKSSLSPLPDPKSFVRKNGGHLVVPARFCDNCRTSPCRCKRINKTISNNKPQAKCYYCKNSPCVCVPMIETTHSRPFRKNDSSYRRRKNIMIDDEDNGYQGHEYNRFVACPRDRQRIRKYCYRNNPNRPRLDNPPHPGERIR